MHTKHIRRKARADIGARLRAIRTDRGMSQVVAGDRAGLHQSIISRLEQGECLSLENLTRMATAYEVSLDEIVRGEQSAAA